MMIDEGEREAEKLIEPFEHVSDLDWVYLRLILEAGGGHGKFWRDVLWEFRDRLRDYENG